MAKTSLGRLMTAMVTPFDESGELDLVRARELAARLVDQQLNDALVINGTTGESPTTTDDEKVALIKAVKEEIGDRAQVVAGVGSNNTAHTCKLAKRCAEAGADALLVVTPYYNLPPQQAIYEHFVSVANASDLPIIMYDIPHRTGREIATETILRLSQHPHIAGVKDAKSDLAGSAQIIAETDLQYWAGDDSKVLPLLALGAWGVVGTSTHFTGRRTKQIIEAFLANDNAKALEIYRELLPVYTGVFATQGVSMVKAGLAHQGFNVGGVRLPMIMPTAEQETRFAEILDSVEL